VFDSGVGVGAWRSKIRHRLRCPSVLDVASFESGDLSALRSAVVGEHSRRCAHCACSLAEIQQARNEILGPLPAARALAAQRAAAEIEMLLRRRLH
jgi:hypothetical protein